jgi:hypothetical protein
MQWSKTKETLLVLILALVIGYRFSRQPLLLWIAGLLVVIGLFAPSLANGIHRGWMKLSEILGAIMSRVLLTVIFFLFIMPLGFISRMLGKNDLILTPSEPSFFKVRDHVYTKEDLEHPW